MHPDIEGQAIDPPETVTNGGRRQNEKVQMESSESNHVDLLLKRFEQPDEVRTFEHGKFELVHAGKMVIGRASYEPGWKWSEHVGKASGDAWCRVDHVGMVVSGRAAVRMDDGRQVIMSPGDVFVVGPGHDSWVVGDEPYVSLHFLGAGDYATSD